MLWKTETTDKENEDAKSEKAMNDGRINNMKS